MPGGHPCAGRRPFLDLPLFQPRRGSLAIVPSALQHEALRRRRVRSLERDGAANSMSGLRKFPRNADPVHESALRRRAACCCQHPISIEVRLRAQCQPDFEASKRHDDALHEVRQRQEVCTVRLRVNDIRRYCVREARRTRAFRLPRVCRGRGSRKARRDPTDGHSGPHERGARTLRRLKMLAQKDIFADRNRPSIRLQKSAATTAH
jgi:hypothetical protein